MVGSRERERINFRESTPRAAPCRPPGGERERKYQGTLRSNNPPRPNRPSPPPLSPPSPRFLPVCRKKIKNLDRDMRGKSISDWRRLARHRRLCVIRKRNREADGRITRDTTRAIILRDASRRAVASNNTERCVNSGILAVTREGKVTRQILRILRISRCPDIKVLSRMPNFRGAQHSIVLQFHKKSRKPAFPQRHDPIFKKSKINVQSRRGEAVADAAEIREIFARSR